MKTFVKRNTVREISILEWEFAVDFGRDEIPLILQEVQTEIVCLGEEDKEKAFFRQKEIFRQAIFRILEETPQAQALLEEQQTAIFYRDLYRFLIEVYMEVMRTDSPYAPERIERQ